MKRKLHQNPSKALSWTLACLLFVLFAAGCTGTKNAKSKPDLLEGTWIPVQEEMGGKPLPAAAFASQKLVMHDSSYTMTAESVDKGISRRTGDKMDIYGKEGVNTGKHFTAIYKLVDGQLTICYNLMGTDYPTEFSTQGKPLYFMAVFKKEGAQ
jgi:uncharacterized protein (TIGR03067 family)